MIPRLRSSSSISASSGSRPVGWAPFWTWGVDFWRVGTGTALAPGRAFVAAPGPSVAARGPDPAVGGFGGWPEPFGSSVPTTATMTPPTSRPVPQATGVVSAVRWNQSTSEAMPLIVSYCSV